MAEGDGVVDDFQPVDHLPRQRLSGGRITDLECEHAGAIGHLPLGKVMLWVGHKTGIGDLGDLRVAFQPLSQRQRPIAMGSDAQGQRRCAARNEPGVEGG